MKTATKDQHESNTKASEEKKYKWSKILSHHKNMILRKVSLVGKVKAEVPAKEALQVANQ